MQLSVPTDLANWGPSGPDRTTKVFRTGPNGPGPDLPEKECDEMLQKTCQVLTRLNAHVWFLFESFLLSFYKVLIALKSEGKKSNIWQTVLIQWMSLYCQLLEKSLGAIKIWKQTHVEKGIKYPRCH